jgi:hypothetical protein
MPIDYNPEKPHFARLKAHLPGLPTKIATNTCRLFAQPDKYSSLFAE